MKLNEILKESNPDINSPEEFYDFIKTNCGPYLSAVGTELMFRGINIDVNLGDFFIGEYPHNRKPVDNSSYLQQAFDEVLASNGYKALRSNSIFCTGNVAVAQSYGQPYVVFPMGQFNFTYSTEINDLYASAEDNFSELDADEDLLDDPNFVAEEFLSTFRRNSIRNAIKSQNEIYVNGSKYFMVRLDVYNRMMEHTNESLRETILDEGINDKYIFKAIFTAGGPASGKSTISKKLLGHMGFKDVNVDRFVEYFANKKNLDMKSMQDWDKEVFDKSNDLVSNSLDLYVAGRLPLIIDGTGKNYDKIVSLAKRLEAIGYDTGLLFVNTDLATTIARNQSRDRTVDTEFLKKAWQQVQSNIGVFQNYFGNDMFIVDNNSDKVDLAPVSSRIQKFLNAPVNNPAAKQWMASKKGSK